MTPDQAAATLSLLYGSWRHKWTQDEEEVWLHDLVTVEADVAVDAIRALRDTTDFAPSWRAFLDACGTVRATRAADHSRRLALANPDTREFIPCPPDVMKQMRGFLSRARGMDQDDEILRKTMLMREHDHSDIRVVGWSTKHVRGEVANKEGDVVDTHVSLGQVPAWWFSCPRCGTPEARIYCDSFTEEGIRVLEELGLRVPAAARARVVHDQGAAF